MITARLLAGVFGLATTGLVVAAVGPATVMSTGGASEVSVSLSDSRAGTAGVTYSWQWTHESPATIRCVSVKFDAASDGSGGMPAGMDLGSATLSAYDATWTTDATNAASGVVVFSSVAGVSRASGTSTLLVQNVTNPAASGTHFMSLTTTDAPASGGSCGGTTVDEQHTVAFATTAGQLTTIAVDPSLSLVVNGAQEGTVCNGVTANRISSSNTVNLGHLSSNSERATGVQTLTVVTNAGGGYSVFVSSTGPLRANSGSGRTYADVAGTHAAPVAWPASGTEAFGYTVGDVTEKELTQFASGGFAALSQSPALVMHNVTAPPPTGDTDCIAYQVAKAGDTPVDSYTTTVLYGVSARF